MENYWGNIYGSYEEMVQNEIWRIEEKDGEIKSDSCKKCFSFEIETATSLRKKHFLCLKCGNIWQDNLNCEHDYKVVKHTIINGQIRASKICTKCLTVTGQVKLKDHTKFAKHYTYDEWQKGLELIQEKVYNDPVWKEMHEKSNLIKGIKYNERKNLYYDYLQSNEWKEKSTAAKERDNYTCQICGAIDDLDVHHLTYKHVLTQDGEINANEYSFELVTLCHTCHISTYHPEKLKL
jgi:hypothetical protein